MFAPFFKNDLYLLPFGEGITIVEKHA